MSDMLPAWRAALAGWPDHELAALLAEFGALAALSPAERGRSLSRRHGGYWLARILIDVLDETGEPPEAMIAQPRRIAQ